MRTSDYNPAFGRINYLSTSAGSTNCLLDTLSKIKINCACTSPRFLNSITFTYPITAMNILFSLTTRTASLSRIWKNRFHKSEWHLSSVLVCPHFLTISDRFRLHIIVINTSGCPIYRAIATVPWRFRRRYLSLPTCVELKKNIFPRFNPPLVHRPHRCSREWHLLYFPWVSWSPVREDLSDATWYRRSSDFHFVPHGTQKLLEQLTWAEYDAKFSFAL